MLLKARGRGLTFMIVDGSCALFVLPPCVFLCFAVGCIGLDAVVVIEHPEVRLQYVTRANGDTNVPD